jgi:hypothetical protein
MDENMHLSIAECYERFVQPRAYGYLRKFSKVLMQEYIKKSTKSRKPAYVGACVTAGCLIVSDLGLQLNFSE